MAWLLEQCLLGRKGPKAGWDRVWRWGVYAAEAHMKTVGTGLQMHVRIGVSEHPTAVGPGALQSSAS